MSEKTFAIIKPNAVQNKHVGKILSLIEQDGFEITELKMQHLKKAQAEGFYAEHSQRPFFNGLVEFMTSSPVVLMVLQTSDAINKWRKLMGATNPTNAAPGTIRALYGDDVEKNSVHGSDSPASAAREISFFFGGK